MKKLNDQKRLSRGVSADMSPEAVYRRLMITAELHELASLLREAKPATAPVGAEKECRASQADSLWTKSCSTASSAPT